MCANFPCTVASTSHTSQPSLRGGYIIIEAHKECVQCECDHCLTANYGLLHFIQ